MEQEKKQIHPNSLANLTNRSGRPKGAKNKYTLYQEEVLQREIVENAYLTNWAKKLNSKIMEDKIRPEAIAPAIEKLAKYVVRTAADQEILDNVFTVDENDINQDIAELDQDLALIETLRKR
ncbi:hypothetical protein RWE39_004397 [Salmonella enterica]|nr:hypothetical protein [Salmonella enterica]EMD5616187.1 hypothetical protein [Salmonella enterica]